MSDDHNRGTKVGEFCTQPGNPCSCGHDYIEVCKPGWASWTFKRRLRLKSGTINFPKKYEAHHLLCVSSVTEIIPPVESIVMQTKWCINEGVNMLGMPLWGHTVMHYANITAAGGALKDTLVPPVFQNIPQHDWDHNGENRYTWEVTQAMKKFARDVKSQGHKIKTENIKGALDKLSGKFKNILLNVRGTRQNGTHEAFKMGINDPSSRWFEPFSMSSTSFITKKGFPLKNFDDRTKKWINRIAQAIAAGGS